ncbi:MAG: thermonuclease family protein [Myxococcales bacterium]|nr:thermonuclease family protein [Myxococcales bacterium]
MISLPLRLLAVTALLLALSCAGVTTEQSKRFTKDETRSLLKRLETVSLELGEFPIEGASSVLDGDTIKVKGLPASLRLLGLDTEETFKKDSERAAFAAGWEQYKKQMQGTSSRPAKYATPLGEDAKHYAQAFFEDVREVRMERDHPGEIRDFYNRYLAYVFAKKNGQWVNYNVECVRAGFSPYFVKYGRSRRFHKEFVDAEREAREGQRGIWKQGAMAYPDYEERLKWWAERAAVITRFEKAAVEDPEHYIALTRWDAMLKLESKVGQEVTILGSVSDLKYSEGTGPSVVKLARTRTNDFDVVFFDRDVLLSTGVQFKKSEYVQVRGTVQKYKNEKGWERLQVVVSLPGQVLAPSTSLEKLLTDDQKRADRSEEDD